MGTFADITVLQTLYLIMRVLKVLRGCSGVFGIWTFSFNVDFMVIVGKT